MKNYYSKLNENDIIEVLKLLSKPTEPKREYVVLTGLSGMYMFNFAMRGIDLPKGIKYSWVIFKKLPNILYINIGNKHDNTKIKVDMINKRYTAMLGTKVLGTTGDINKTVKLFNF